MSIECFTMFAFGFLVGWWMCVATWPRFTRRKPRHDRSGPQLSEGGLDDITPDRVIVNDGTIDQLKAKIYG